MALFNRPAAVDTANVVPSDDEQQPVESTFTLLQDIRALLQVMAAPLLSPSPRHALVDIHESPQSATSVTLRQVTGSIVLIKTILYSAPAAAQITIGDRIIAVPAAALAPLQVEQMVLYPSDSVTLSLTGTPTAGALHLEIIGTAVSQHERLEVVR